jgi:aminopeptidase N
VRPAEYREINNFYTATVYEKGAELVRMLAGRLGAEGFRRGTDRYFARNDGRAATLEDFLAALGEANDIDLSPYLAWYGQAGTPRLKARGEYDAARREYALTLSQHTPPSHGQPHKQPLPVPVKLALFGRDGRMRPLHLDGRTAEPETVVVLDQTERRFVFRDVDAPPVPSLLRGFSAPVILEYDYAPDELALLLTHDADGFNRWEAGQQLAARAFDALRDEGNDAAPAAWCEALATLFAQDGVDDALLADLLTPPGELELADRQAEADPALIHDLRQSLQRRLAGRLGTDALHARYQALAARTSLELDAASQATRRLKRRVLELLVLLDAERAYALAAAQYRDAPGMTDRLAALGVLVRGQAPQAAAALAHFRTRYDDNALALDKWFAVQAQIPGEPALARVRALESDPRFTLKNPNRARALLGSWASGNPSGFHRADGAGYALYAERLAALDALNPQIAARLATAFNGWKRLEPARREAARRAMAQLLGRAELSRNLGEILGNMLQD